jgi:hypothetical protein
MVGDTVRTRTDADREGRREEDEEAPVPASALLYLCSSQLKSKAAEAAGVVTRRELVEKRHRGLGARGPRQELLARTPVEPEIRRISRPIASDDAYMSRRPRAVSTSLTRSMSA